MSAELYQNISTVAFVLAAIFLLVAVILFFILDIPAVLGELSGKTAAKQVAEIRAANKNAVAKRRPVPTATSSNQRTTTKLTSGGTNQLAKANQNNNKIDETELLVENTGAESYETELLSSETELLQPETELLTNETTYLGPETTLLSPETTLLSPETTLLSPETTLLSPDVPFEIVQDVVVVHTREFI